MSNHEALRRALIEAETAINNAQGLIDGDSNTGEQALEDLRFACNIVAELRGMLEVGTWEGQSVTPDPGSRNGTDGGSRQ